MRGIVLAGGTGSRLGRLTAAVNKHLLPVGGKPMIYWPINTLRTNGIEDITIVSTPRGIGQLAEMLSEPPLMARFTYRVQIDAGGIAQALLCAGYHNDRAAVILGDNVFLPSPELDEPLAGCAMCFLKEVPADRAREFGVPTFSDVPGDWRITHIDEKPTVPRCNYAVTGLYIFDNDVFRRIRNLRKSARGEYEVTDLLNTYAASGELSHKTLSGFWGDAGTHEGMTECSDAVRKWGKL